MVQSYTMATPNPSVNIGMQSNGETERSESITVTLRPAAAEDKTANPSSRLVEWREELKRFEEFGLGLGVDSTTPSPFANKKSFHVRPVDQDTIICIDEGGALHSIFQKLETSDENTIQLSASITLPETPIQIGAAVEYSRSTARRGYTIGREVITRSVAFRMDRHLSEEAGLQIEYFEEWINQRLKIRPFDVQEMVELIIRHGITHYVSKIKLGAALYCTMSEVYYSTFVRGKKDIGVDKMAELALSASKKRTSSSQVSETKRIGFMSGDYVVRRGTYDEAVLGVELESVANLIKNEGLRDAVTKALRIYIATRGTNSIGYKESSLFGCLIDFSDGNEIDGDVVNKFGKLMAEIRKVERPPNSKRYKGAQ